MTKTTIQIGSFELAVEVLPVTTRRDWSVQDITAQTDPIPVSEWPMTPAEISAAANAKLTATGGRPSEKADCVWALKAIRPDGFIVRPATTQAQRRAEQADYRLSYLRGEVS